MRNGQGDFMQEHQVYAGLDPYLPAVWGLGSLSLEVLAPGSQARLSSSSPIGLGSQGGAGALGPGMDTVV